MDAASCKRPFLLLLVACLFLFGRVQARSGIERVAQNHLGGGQATMFARFIRDYSAPKANPSKSKTKVPTKPKGH
ncbi:hypothetical protein GOP47_0003921 [Adiantum capillus-veneris]|uniref:Uncharacterized protein n=1 Tax=Adiantum capillus-veneris TaxID=13818 RepID=A0A9D4ZM40_ADICA|nr:hypothetical protein GOP47_0003921 [Adiantum capillus-veneris]